jgi:hypothetical protein
LSAYGWRPPAEPELPQPIEPVAGGPLWELPQRADLLRRRHSMLRQHGHDLPVRRRQLIQRHSSADSTNLPCPLTIFTPPGRFEGLRGRSRQSRGPSAAHRTLAHCPQPAASADATLPLCLGIGGEPSARSSEERDSRGAGGVESGSWDRAASIRTARRRTARAASSWARGMKLGSARSILSSSKPLRGASHSQSRSGGTPTFGLLRVRRTSSATGVPVFSPSGFWPSGDSARTRRVPPGTPRFLPIPSPVCLRLPGGRFGTWALVEGDSVCVMRSWSLPR